MGPRKLMFSVSKLIHPRLALSRPLNHWPVNLRVDSCLDVPYSDGCPQQMLPILLHGHLAESAGTHMARWAWCLHTSRWTCFRPTWVPGKLEFALMATGAVEDSFSKMPGKIFFIMTSKVMGKILTGILLLPLTF